MLCKNKCEMDHKRKYKTLEENIGISFHDLGLNMSYLRYDP